MSAEFFTLGIVVGLIGKLGMNGTIETYIEGFKEYKPREGGEKDYRRKSDREKPKFFSKKSKDFKDRNFNAGNRKK